MSRRKKKLTGLPAPKVESLDDSNTFVEYGVSALVKTGEYENMKISASIRIPVYHTTQQLADAKEAMKVAKEIIISRIDEDISNINVD